MGRKRHCRLCAKLSSTNVHIFGERGQKLMLHLKILKHSSVTVTKQDPLPKHVCLFCIGKLDFIEKFVTDCKKSQIFFRRNQYTKSSSPVRLNTTENCLENCNNDESSIIINDNDEFDSTNESQDNVFDPLDVTNIEIVPNKVEVNFTNENNGDIKILANSNSSVFQKCDHQVSIEDNFEESQKNEGSSKLNTSKITVKSVDSLNELPKEEKNKIDLALITFCNDSNDTINSYDCINDNEDDFIENDPFEGINQCDTSVNYENDAITNSGCSIVLNKNDGGRIHVLSGSNTNINNICDKSVVVENLVTVDENNILTSGIKNAEEPTFNGDDIENFDIEEPEVFIESKYSYEAFVNEGYVGIETSKLSEVKENILNENSESSILKTLLGASVKKCDSSGSLSKTSDLIGSVSKKSDSIGYLNKKSDSIVGSSDNDDDNNDNGFNVEPDVEIHSDETKEIDFSADINLYMRFNERTKLSVFSTSYGRYFECIENIMKRKCSMMPYFAKGQFSKSEQRIGFKCFICSKIIHTQKAVFDHLYSHCYLFCPFCNEIYRTSSQLIKHVSNKHNFDLKKKFKCSQCDESCDNVKVYLNHINVHSKYKCPFCDYENGNPGMYTVHLKNNHAKYVNKCSGIDCSLYYFNNEQWFTKHVNKICENSFKCNACGISFHSKEFLNIHYEIYGKLHNISTTTNFSEEKTGDNFPDKIVDWTKNKQCIQIFQDIVLKKIPIKERKIPGTNKFNCYCGRAVDMTGDKVLNHVLSHLLTTCFKCSKIIKTVKRFVSHMDYHPTFKDYKCIFCKTNFNSLKEYVSHVKVHYAKKICLNCYEVFHNYDDKRRHCRSKHSNNEVTNVCDYCGKVFKTNQSLRNHIKIIHNGEKNEKICPVCGKIGVCNSCNLKDNEKFICAYCSKVFHRKESIRAHIMVHLDLKSFKCKICYKKFNRNSSLTKHMKDMHSLKEWCCYYKGCTSSYSFKSALQTHLKSSHNVEEVL